MSKLVFVEDQIQSVNDCVVKFANVNGTGSASANGMFAKSVFRMGIPISPRNIFPSNIQGLPTWYEVRISEQGYLGRREGVDLMVAMNAQTLAKDIQSINSGGYLLYDSTKTLPENLIRPDINLIGIPFTRLCLEEYGNIKARHMYKNILVLGALTALLNIEEAVVEKLIEEQFARKPKLIQPNIEALHIGRGYTLNNIDCPIGLRLERSDKTGDAILIDGNTAAGLGCVYAGATVAAWYPITPSTSLVEGFEKYANQLRIDDEGNKKFAIAQAEDELAAIGMVIGANWNGARAFTATSGPGISLMSEFLGLAYFAEVPAVLFDIQRGGPSTGMPTRTQQSDLIASAYASHGDTKHVLLFPGNPGECFTMSADAFDLAERLQTPVIVMSDLDIGMQDWVTQPLQWDDSRRYDRGKVLTAEDLDNMTERFGRYLDVDGDGICYRTYPGTHPEKGAFFTRGTSRDRYAVYSEDPDVYVDNMERLVRKFETAKSYVPQPEVINSQQPTSIGVIYFGSTQPAMDEAADLLAAQGVHVNRLRIRAFPFADSIRDFINQHETVFVVEQNRDAQMRQLLASELDFQPSSLKPVLYYGGMPITATFIADAIAQQLSPQHTGKAASHTEHPALSEVK